MSIDKELLDRLMQGRSPGDLLSYSEAPKHSHHVLVEFLRSAQAVRFLPGGSLERQKNRTARKKNTSVPCGPLKFSGRML